MIRFFAHSVAFVLLTLLTQVGGLAYGVALLTSWRVARRGKRHPLLGPATFVGMYIVISAIAWLTAPHFGRVALPCRITATTTLAVQSPIYCAMNRHYVSLTTLDAARRLAAHMDKEFPNTLTLALDAGFPFLNGFPLLPHLSHDDGRKIDLAFYYQDAAGRYARGRTRSPIGYWAFEEPRQGDNTPCAGRKDWLTLRWDMDWFQSLNGAETLETRRTREMLRWLARESAEARVAKVLIEPHLVQRLGISSPKFRFQGCRAARHDDHVHIQVPQ